MRCPKCNMDEEFLLQELVELHERNCKGPPIMIGLIQGELPAWQRNDKYSQLRIHRLLCRVVQEFG